MMSFYENSYFIKVIPSIRKHAYGDAVCAASDAFPVIFHRKTTGLNLGPSLLISNPYCLTVAKSFNLRIPKKLVIVYCATTALIAFSNSVKYSMISLQEGISP